ncbi:MAG: extradiol dioxygenase [bacterium]
MITGMHALLYSSDPDATRTFFRDVLKMQSVDAGRGWLIFAMPPAELAIHPTDEEHAPDMYLMCDNLESTLAELQPHIEVTRSVSEQRWGKLTAIRIPGGVEVGLYEPRHPTALALAAEVAARYAEPMR